MCDEPMPLPEHVEFSPFFYRHQCPKLCGDCSRMRAYSPVGEELRAPCPRGWNYTEGSCFKVYHHLGTDPTFTLNFNTANHNCIAAGARLAQVDSPAKNHLALELLRQRSPQASAKHTSTTAWIGLRTVRYGNVSNQSHWYWLSSGKTLTWSNWGEADRSKGVSWKSPYDDPLRKAHRTCAVLNYPDTNYRWEAVFCNLWRVPSWICEVPAAVQTVATGKCADYGLAPIRNARDCEAAAEGMGLEAPIASPTSHVPAPEGCYYNRYRALFFSAAPENEGTGGVLHSRSDPSSFYHGMGRNLYLNNSVWDIQICFNASAKGAVDAADANATIVPEGNQRANDRFRPAELEKSSNTDAEEILIALCAAYASVLVLLAARGRGSLSSALRIACSLLSRALAFPWRGAGKDDALQEKVRKALLQRQDRLAIFIAGAHLLYRLLRLTIVVLTEERCDVSRTTHAVVIGAQALEVLFAVAPMLVEQGRHRRRLFRAFVLAIPLSKLLQLSLSRDLLIGGTRLYEDLFWRLLLGAAVSWPKMVAMNAAYSAGVLILHQVTVPSGMIILPSLKQGCSIIVPPAEWEVINGGWVWMHQQVVGNPRTRALAGEALWALVRQGGQATTSFQRAAFPELLVLAVSVFASLLLLKIMESDLRGQLKLQASESFVEAFSEMLDKLCDAVVHLDANLQLQGLSQRFAALLTRTRSAGFRQHLYDAQEDDRLRGALETRGDGNGCTINVDFKDTFGTRVPCQIFHVQFRSFDGQPHYLLGINEIGERHVPLEAEEGSDATTSELSGPGAAGQPPPVELEQQVPAEQNAQAPHGPDSATPPSSSADDLSSSLATSGKEQVAHQEMQLSFCDFRILAVSERVRAMFKNSPVDSFLDAHIEDFEDQNSLYRWQKAAGGALRRGDATEPFCRTVTLRSQAWCRSSRERGAARARRVELQVEPMTPPAGGVTDIEAMAVTVHIRRLKQSKTPSGDRPSDCSGRSAKRKTGSSEGVASSAPVCTTSL